MAKKRGEIKPLISGGRTLSKMHGGTASSSGGKVHGLKKIWWERMTKTSMEKVAPPTSEKARKGESR